MDNYDLLIYKLVRNGYGSIIEHMTIEEMYGHFMEIENDLAVENFIKNAKETDKFYYPYAKKT